MKTKILLAALAISALLCVPAQAQDEPRHEVGISYGMVPNSVWIDVLTDVIPAIFGENAESKGYVGPIGLEYYYHTSPLVGVGAVAVFATHNEDASVKEILKNHRIKSYYSLMPSVKFNWLRKDKWGMYSKVALGATLTSFSTQDYNESGKLIGEKKTDNDVLFNFQASLIGVEAGSQQVRGFIELGIGEQGIALAGVRYKF
jgi:hypothetical protein